MTAYWIKFNGRPAGCVSATTKEEATALAKEITGKEVVGCEILPYPANPRLNEADGGGFCPSFCYHPEQCQGHTSCPQHYSCTE